MSDVERRFRFVVDDKVALDLNDVADSDPDQAAELIVLLDELRGDRKVCECLIDVGYEDDSIRSVKPFAAMQRGRYNVYTVRAWEVDDWRIITGVDHRQREIGILYIMKRSEDYDHVVQQHVQEAYDRLGFAKFGQ